MDSIEKIYCTGHDNDALVAALANHNNNDPMANGGMNNWANNPLT